MEEAPDAKPCRAVIFDLDGTLLDTLADLASAINKTLLAEGYPTHSVEDCRYLVGEGVARLFAKALPPDDATEENVAKCCEVFREIYLREWDIHTRPYEGIAELLDELASLDIKAAVLSNKPHEFTLKCIDRHFGETDFVAVFGQREGVPRKPHPAAAAEIAETLNIAPSEVMFLGDTSIDMQTAVAAGMTAVGVSWGFRDAQEMLDAGAWRVIDHPHELTSLVERS